MRKGTTMKKWEGKETTMKKQLWKATCMKMLKKINLLALIQSL